VGDSSIIEAGRHITHLPTQDLKVEEFEPEHAGKMNFYLSAVDDQMKHPHDQPSIGIILCQSYEKIVAQYVLRDMTKPIGVSSYVTKLVATLPADFRGQLPDPKQLKDAYKKATKVSDRKPHPH
jgi:hypothetical protein